MKFFSLSTTLFLTLNILCSSLFGYFGLTTEQIDSMNIVLNKAQSYEMNYILYDLGYIDTCNIPNYYSAEYSNFDEPMGVYTEEELQKYTTDDIDVEIEYLYDRNDSTGSEDGQTMVLQIFKIYLNGEMVTFQYAHWGWSYWASENPFDESKVGEIGEMAYSKIKVQGLINATIVLEKENL